ncbi:terminase large subunit [Oenococcus sp.]|uniref:terminase large subunit n=1 Tax=Oenococcus sp. TaxID=1979414 RepID=UPI0039E79BE1
MTDPVTQYCKDVLDGKILAGKLQILACQRHLDDLEKSKLAVYQYYFDEERLNAFFLFASLVPDPVKGKPLPLMGWEQFAMGSVIAWRQKTDQARRFHNGIISVARDQGKTYMASILACYSFLIESAKLSNQDIIVASNKYKQIKKIYSYILKTVRLMKKDLFADTEIGKDLVINNDEIRMDSKQNRIIKLTAKGGGFDSFHASVAIYDEAGEQQTRKYFNDITSGQTKNPNALMLEISSAYANPNSPFRDDIEKVAKAIKDGKGEMEDYFLAVWAQDDESEIDQPETWIKSNPLLGIEATHDTMLKQIVARRDTQLIQGERDDFLTKQLNLWINAQADAAFPLEDIQNSVIDKFDMDGKQVYIGFDNSMTSDDAAFSFVFPYEEKKFFAYEHSFIPWRRAGSIEAKEKQDGINYRHMEELGFASITKNIKGVIDEDFMYDWLMKFVKDHDLEVLGFMYDTKLTWGIVPSIEQSTGWYMIPVVQTSMKLNEPTKWLQKALLNKTITHLKDPMMEASLVNAIVISANNLIKIDKNKGTKKIDLVDALVDALYQAIYHFEDYSPNDNRITAVDRLSSNKEKVKEYINSGKFGFGG